MRILLSELLDAPARRAQRSDQRDSAKGGIVKQSPEGIGEWFGSPVRRMVLAYLPPVLDGGCPLRCKIAALRCAREFPFQLAPDVRDIKSGASCDTPLAGHEAYSVVRTESVRFPTCSRGVIYVKDKLVESLLYFDPSACLRRLETEHVFD
jgi:hypothetical protein